MERHTDMTVIKNKEMARTLRHCQRVLRMVAELHKRGFQGLRIFPYQGALGAWRVELYPYDDFDLEKPMNLLFDRNSCLSPARHSGAARDYFDWSGSSNYNARQLASKFEEKFPLLCHYCKGRDWKYAGWYQELMGILETDTRLPCITWPYMEEQGFNLLSPAFLPIKKFDEEGYFVYERSFPLPPFPEFHALS